jgi:hypothetical protein
MTIHHHHKKKNLMDISSSGNPSGNPSGLISVEKEPTSPVFSTLNIDLNV